jgi:hypothetical protein
VDRVVIVLVKNDAFVVVKNIQRSIDVSHYGKIHVQDEVVIENNGESSLAFVQFLLTS